MAFNMEEFIKTNLTKGYIDKDFSEVQINIFLVNYLSKGMISQDTFDEIVQFMKDNKPNEDIPDSNPIIDTNEEENNEKDDSSN